MHLVSLKIDLELTLTKIAETASAFFTSGWRHKFWKLSREHLSLECDGVSEQSRISMSAQTFHFGGYFASASSNHLRWQSLTLSVYRASSIWILSRQTRSGLSFPTKLTLARKRLQFS